MSHPGWLQFMLTLLELMDYLKERMDPGADGLFKCAVGHYGQQAHRSLGISFSVAFVHSQSSSPLGENLSLASGT